MSAPQTTDLNSRKTLILEPELQALRLSKRVSRVLLEIILAIVVAAAVALTMAIMMLATAPMMLGIGAAALARAMWDGSVRD